MGVEMIQNLKDLVVAQDAELQRLAKSPRMVATVAAITGNGVALALDGRTMMVEPPQGMSLQRGDEVLVTDTGQIIAKSEDKLHMGNHLATVKAIIDDVFVVVTLGGTLEERLVSYDPDVLGVFKPGDTVLLDQTRSVITRKLNKENSTMDHSLSKIPQLEWDDVCGLEDAKTLLRQAVEDPYEYPDLFKAYGKKPAKGILLYGPPGCGKTMLARLVAGVIARTHHGTGSTPKSYFISVKGPELQEKLVGETEKNIRELFSRAKQHQDQHGYPAVIFLDEADVLLGSRDKNGSNTYRNDVVAQFLTEMDGLEESPALVILATNREQDLDPAVLRDGRIDAKIYIGRPDMQAVRQIFIHALKDVPLGKHGKKSLGLEEAAETTTQALFSDKFLIDQLRIGDKSVPFCLRDIVNGAMVVGIVERAKGLAIARDMALGHVTGLTLDDLTRAVVTVFEENAGLNHDEAKALFKDAHQNQKLAA